MRSSVTSPASARIPCVLLRSAQMSPWVEAIRWRARPPREKTSSDVKGMRLPPSSTSMGARPSAVELGAAVAVVEALGAASRGGVSWPQATGTEDNRISQARDDIAPESSGRTALCRTHARPM